MNPNNTLKIRVTEWLNSNGHGKPLLSLVNSLRELFGLNLKMAATLARDWMCYRI